MKDILSEFSQFVQSPHEETVGDNAELNPVLAEILEEFGDSLMSKNTPVQEDKIAATPVEPQKEVGYDRKKDEEADAAIMQLLETLDYYEKDSEEEEVSSSDDLNPIPVGDEFFNLDSDDIISGFLREESAIREALKPHKRHSLDSTSDSTETEVALDSPVGELSTQNSVANNLAKSSGMLGFGIFAAGFEYGKISLSKYHIWKNINTWFAAAETWQLIVLGLLSFVLCGLVMHYCRRRNGDRIKRKFGYDFMGSTDELDW